MPSRFPHLVTNEPDDPYQLQDPGHNPDAFYTFCGKDSETIRVRVPNVYLYVISDLCASREIPEIKTPADFIRDAIHHRTYWYQHHYRKPEVGDTITAYAEMERSKERAAMLQTRKDAIVQFRTEFDLAYQSRNRNACQEVIEAVGRSLESRDASDDHYKSELGRLMAAIRLEMDAVGWATP